ncbi:hypothetical protein TTHERM_00901770 (macronuclear) [Tetrahymena thermophila SB210]|uniref:Uncharacterized protein n=1 Tax=Tetrahymena thermophila (strain SB210) TaxID=312017 RepID=Q24GC2_TETTS|nr:hypothetical protein TTHERM_00901770 [Tetrahymena thermophila SB210]EAS06808.2 hypothetical protein TTHERM_00901770 [Tetrahymena thermophila SB210]|eukprot:XP_001027050.2 hypothetical protein TTHERM_00901770 [Tetrahymena thermophila SB210]
MIKVALQMILQNSQQYIVSLNPANMYEYYTLIKKDFFPFLTRYTLTNKIAGMIIPQMINRGCNKDQSNQQNHKGCKLGLFAYKQSIDLLIAPNGLPDIYTGTEIAIKLLNKLQIKERICK